jgi:hypothetical protein
MGASDRMPQIMCQCLDLADIGQQPHDPCCRIPLIPTAVAEVHLVSASAVWDEPQAGQVGFGLLECGRGMLRSAVQLSVPAQGLRIGQGGYLVDDHPQSCAVVAGLLPRRAQCRV